MTIAYRNTPSLALSKAFLFVVAAGLAFAASPAAVAQDQPAANPEQAATAPRVEMAHPDWNDNLEDALQDAQRQGRPLFVFFGSGSNPPTAAMLRETLAGNEVRLALRSVGKAIIDVDAKPEVAGEHEITSLPTFIVLDNRGKEYDRFSGFLAPAAFIETFRAAADPDQTIPLLKRRARENPRDLETRWNLARKYARDRNANDLYPLLTEMREIDPENDQGYLDNVAYLEFMTSLNPRIPEDALDSAEDFLNEYPQSEFAADVTLTQAHLAYMIGEKDKCLSILDAFPRRFPDSPMARDVEKNFRRIRAEVEKEAESDSGE